MKHWLLCVCLSTSAKVDYMIENIQYFKRLTKGSSVSIKEMTAAMLFYLQGPRDWMKN